jgi:hypothetical protein
VSDPPNVRVEESVLISRMVMEIVRGSANAARAPGTDMRYAVYFFLSVAYRLRKKAIFIIYRETPQETPRDKS